MKTNPKVKDRIQLPVLKPTLTTASPASPHSSCSQAPSVS